MTSTAKLTVIETPGTVGTKFRACFFEQLRTTRVYQVRVLGEEGGDASTAKVSEDVSIFIAIRAQSRKAAPPNPSESQAEITEMDGSRINNNSQSDISGELNKEAR